MGRLTLVRHGQTEGAWNDRDRLSELGKRQATLLGERWASTGRRLGTVYVGPRRRHQQTWEAVAHVYRGRGLTVPEPVEVPELDEFMAEALFQVLMPKLAEQDERARALLESSQGASMDMALAYRFLERVGRVWARGEVRDASVEPWETFVARVNAAVEGMTREAPKGAEVVAFTSAGPVAVATGQALAAEHERTFALSLMVRNTSCTDFLFSGGRVSLESFNGTAHLTDASMETVR